MWTPQTRPRVQPQPQSDNGPDSAMHYILPVGRSWQSVLAPYLGVLALVAFVVPVAAYVLGAAAIGCGVWAMVRAQSGGHGRGRAIVAIVLGLLAILLGAAASAALSS
ncbi:hypothetical protein SAMN06309944_0363 [Micrococcales bacterium KH10]|nr:hypothetical protein SAMN06309944_0363 [Micrococcales bacterium KH10]